MKAVTTGLIALAGTVSATVPLYGQCGGIGYSGETACVSGAFCQYLNDYYSQCVAGMETLFLLVSMGLNEGDRLDQKTIRKAGEYS